MSLLLINLTSCFTPEIKLQSDFCESYFPFQRNFSKDVKDYADNLAINIARKENNGELMTPEEKLHSYFVNYADQNERIAEKKECYNE